MTGISKAKRRVRFRLSGRFFQPQEQPMQMQPAQEFADLRAKLANTMQQTRDEMLTQISLTEQEIEARYAALTVEYHAELDRCRQQRAELREWSDKHCGLPAPVDQHSAPGAVEKALETKAAA